METLSFWELFLKLAKEFCFGGSGLILVCLIIGLMLPGGRSGGSGGDIVVTINKSGD